MQNITATALVATLVSAQGKSGEVRKDFLQWAASQGKNYSNYGEM
jgi:hypothetical protein